jgi:DNA-binding LacI/PurR family transcriptional regulator
VPVVLINSRGREKTSYTYSVMVDNRQGGSLAAEHLIKLGHRHLAYVAGPPNHSDDVERLAGFRQALAGEGMVFDESSVVPGTGSLHGGERALPVLLALQARPTAVFCYNDLTAIGLLRAARQAGLSVPRDLSVVGFDDIPFSSYMYPSLTTIAQPMAEMGRQATEMVLALSTNGTSHDGLVTDLVVRGRLIARESSGPAD